MVLVWLLGALVVFAPMLLEQFADQVLAAVLLGVFPEVWLQADLDLDGVYLGSARPGTFAAALLFHPDGFRYYWPASPGLQGSCVLPS